MYSFESLQTKSKPQSNPLGNIIQPKLKIGQPNDKYEQEADSVADAVMRMPDSQLQMQTAEEEEEQLQMQPVGEEEEEEKLQMQPIEEEEEEKLQMKQQVPELQRMCPRCRECARQGKPLDCPECEKKLQMQSAIQKQEDGQAYASPEMSNQLSASKGQGASLPTGTQQEMSHKMGTDFGDVNIHTDSKSHELSRQMGARAFTQGKDIYFNKGQFNPTSNSGKRLLAHELTHVVQQKKANRILKNEVSTARIQRQSGLHGQNIDPMDDPRMHPEGAPKAKSAQKNKKCNIPSDCPDHFCTPYNKASYARHMRTKMMPMLLAGIAVAVGTDVVPVWHSYLLGGSSKKDFTSQFGHAFKNSSTTRDKTNEMKNIIESKIKASPPNFNNSKNINIDLGSLIPGFISDLNTPHRGMNFNIPGEVPGNLAGDIATDQTVCPVGAKPSKIDDDRTAAGKLQVTQKKTGDLYIDPSITYKVQDTVDLCPGNCGTELEQFATVVMSQFEATGISGDVPFEVRFPAPMKPFIIEAWRLSGKSKTKKP